LIRKSTDKRLWDKVQIFWSNTNKWRFN